MPVFAVSCLLVAVGLGWGTFGPSLMPRAPVAATPPPATVATLRNEMKEGAKQVLDYARTQSHEASKAISDLRADVSTITADVAAIRASVKTLESSAVVIGNATPAAPSPLRITSLPDTSQPPPMPKPRAVSPRVFRAAAAPPTPVVFLPSGPPVVVKTAAELEADERAAAARLKEWQRAKWRDEQLSLITSH